MCYRLLLILSSGVMSAALAGQPVDEQKKRTEIGASGTSESLSPDERMLREAKIPTDGDGLIKFFRRRITDQIDQARLQTLITQLGDDSFQIREQASAQLVAAGTRAKSALLDATKSRDTEVAHRAQDCLRRIEQGATSQVISAAVRVMVQRKPAGAVETLLAYVPSVEDESVATEVCSALTKMAMRDGKLEPAFTAALVDKNSAIRATAAVALCRAGITEQMPAIRKLLQDPDDRVRMQIGLALAAAKEKEAIPVLIDLLARPPQQETNAVEELLYRLAGEKAPSCDGSDDATRRACRDAWMKWWDDNGDKITSTKLEEATQALGYTLVVLLDQNKVMELDNNKQPRWTVEGLEFPLDVQILPGDRLLSAEHNGNRVTERDTKTGKVLWEYKVNGPLAAQRLPGGNTFIATRTELIEVNRAGKVLWTYTRPGGEMIMKAQKLRNGEIAMVTQPGSSRFVLLDKDGKTEKRSFGVNLFTSGGRIDVLPNGNVLVPENYNNRVVEQAGPDGKIVWEMEVEAPVAAVRLPNGHTLVTSMNPARGAVELDQHGKDVWNYKATSRVTRALRR